MGQKVNPNSLRLGIVRDWQSKYFASNNKQWAKWVVEDKKIRMYFEKFIKELALSSIEIERTVDTLSIKLHTAKPGAVLGEGGEGIKKHEIQIKRIIKDKNMKLKLDVAAIDFPEVDATIVANEIAVALENRAHFRRVQKMAIMKAMRSGAKGIKTSISGRLNGVDMARTEGYSEGIIPSSTVRNDLDFAKAKAHTTYGVLGVKVWISRGEVLADGTRPKLERPKRPFNKRRPPFNKDGKKPTGTRTPVAAKKED